MTTETMTTRWEAVEKAVADAVSIAWDGCHKIYVLMDKAQHELQIDYGYDPVLVTDTDEALEMLRRWYEVSCPLRFITAVRSVDGDPNLGYESLIEQGAEDTDSEDDD